MSYSELGRLSVVCRPIERWPGPLQTRRRRSPFSAPLAATLSTLSRELRALDGKRVVLQMAITEADLRLDGLPYADTRPEHPGVILAFDSKFGPLQYPTDEFAHWHDNLRAIALGMEALRRVDRYGVSKRGEQYTGWRALPASTDSAGLISTREEADEFLRRWDGDWKRAARETHPDQGGDPDEFRTVMRAKELIGA